MRLLDILKSATEHLKKSGVSDAGADAEMLVFHSTGVDRMTAYRDNPDIDDETRAGIVRLLERRAAGEPVQYILGSVEFLGLRIEVGRGVLIPRPETELVAGEGIRLLHSLAKEPPDYGQAAHRVLDLCSGSGCISLAFGREFPGATIVGTDISGTAIKYARRNAMVNRITNVTFLEGSLYEPVKEMPAFQMIISNPPYIVTSDLDQLQREIREWEPGDALDGGPDGLDFYRKIFSKAGEHLTQRGMVIVELGFGQGAGVAHIAEEAGFAYIDIKKDLAGIERILIAKIAS